MPKDLINKPPHYTRGNIETIDAIQSALSTEGFNAFCQGQIIKYVWRYEHKNGVEDLEKAEWYLKRLIRMQKNDSVRTKNTKVHEDIYKKI